MQLPSYASPYNLGHKAVSEIFDGPVVIQEKIDGSQISFGTTTEGELLMRSRGTPLNLDIPNSMFNAAIAVVRKIKNDLVPGLVFRGEYLMKPKHNVLAYDRIPKNNIVLFDIEDGWGTQKFRSQNNVKEYAELLGFDYAPVYFEGTTTFDPNVLRGYLDNVSCLGGQKIEGIVVKNYNRFTVDKKVMMAKFVSESFKEIHSQEYRKENPTVGDIRDKIINEIRTTARWNKAIQHLKEADSIKQGPEDIGPLIKEIYKDVEKECADYVKEQFWSYFRNDVLRGSVKGFAEWYKEQLRLEALEAEAKGISGS